MTISRPYISFQTKQIIDVIETTLPYVGFNNISDLPNGWRFDIKRWSSIFDLRLPTLPRLSDDPLQGLNEIEFFLSGVGSIKENDCSLKELISSNINETYSWLPVLNSGFYYFNRTKYYLYSDNSRIQYVTDVVNDKNILVLESLPDSSAPLFARSYKRNNTTKEITLNKDVKFCNEFSGIYVDGEEQETVSSARNIFWDNVDYNKDEFIIEELSDGSLKLRFNKDYRQTVGVIPVVYNDLGACDILGPSTANIYQTYFLSQFPVVADSSFHLYVGDGTSFEEWTREPSWRIFCTVPSNKTYFLDEDLGIIYFGTGVYGGIPALETTIFATYQTTLRVEYEEINTNKLVVGNLADVNPITQSLNQGFICLSNKEFSPASISLEINKTHIPFTIPKEYGPITIGSDYAILKAIVKDINNLPVPNTEVTFEMSPILGSLSEGNTSVSATDGYGQAFSVYQPPISADGISLYSTVFIDDIYTDGVILNITEDNVSFDVDNIYIYKVLKDDISLGFQYDSGNTDINDWIDNHFTQPSWVITPADLEQWHEEIILEYDLKEWSQYNLQNSRKQLIITSQTGNVMNPITGLETDPVFVPLRPLSVTRITDNTYGAEHLNKYIMNYEKGIVPSCSPLTGNPVGGYYIVMPRKITFIASCWSKYYNRYIYSNTISSKVMLPNYLLGEYLLNNITKVPYGWKLIEETNNNAAGLNGATFVSINPFGGPYPIIDIETSTPTGDWASAPNTLGFQVHIEE